MKQLSKTRPQTPARPLPAEPEPAAVRRTKKRIAKKTKRPKNIWNAEEDRKLLELIDVYGPAHWSTIAASMPGREGKQCRERWHNHLNPGILKDQWTEAEDLRLFLLYKLYGSKWSVLSFMFSGRTDNSIKNHWNSIMKKKVRRFDAFVKGVVESGDFTDLDPLDVDLIGRIKRAEFDNKNCRKGRTRNYKSFFEKNRLMDFVKMTESEAEDEGWLEKGREAEGMEGRGESDRCWIDRLKGAKELEARPKVGEEKGRPEPESRAAEKENRRMGSVPLAERNTPRARKIPGQGAVFGPPYPQEPEATFGGNWDRSNSPDPSSRHHNSWFSFGIHQEFRTGRKNDLPAKSREQIPSTDKKGAELPHRFSAQMTPTSLVSKLPRGCGLETTAGNAKYEGGFGEGEQTINLCVTSFFACQETSAMKSPLLQLGSQSEISEVLREGVGNHFKGLVTPTKEMFDFSNGKFANSKSSARNGSVFSNLKSLDISKSLEYN